MTFLRAVGDLHGCIDNRSRFNDLPSFMELCKDAGKDNYVVQLGDFGFDYTLLDKLDSNGVKIVLGNHENLDTAFNYPHILHRFGPCTLGPFNFFFVSGGFSVDKNYRIKDQQVTGFKSWWSNEELSQEEGRSCLDLYEQIKPDVVMAHDCPASISSMIGNPEILIAFGWPKDMVSSTQELLQQMVDVHSPRLFLFGHHHKEFHIRYHDTDYYCLPERKYLDFNEEWSIVGGSCYLPY